MKKKQTVSNSVFSLKNIFKLFFWIGFIAIGVSILDSAVVKNFVRNFNNQNNSESVMTSSTQTSDIPSSTQTSGIQTFLDNVEALSKEFDNSAIPVNKEAERIVNESQLIQNLNLQQNDLLTLKQILSDTNPDPDSKIGEVCSFSTTECKWCSKKITNEHHIQSYQDMVQQSLSPFGSLGLLFSSAFIGNSDLKKGFEEICNDFRAGKKYLCIDDVSKSFCSKKCEAEFELYK